MNYKKLGNTDLDVSTICLGTMTWGEQNSQEEGFEQMDYALEQGINFFDTAELYAVPPKKETYGKTEEIIGNWFHKRKSREKVILASKIAGNGLSWIRNGGFQYDEKNITEAIEKSLSRLKTDYIDLYQLHWPERKANYFGKLGYQHNNKEEQWNEIKGSKDRLEKIIDKPVRTFAYPYYNEIGFKQNTLDLVRSAGFQVACAYTPGQVRFRSNPFQFPRFLVRNSGGEIFRETLKEWAN